MDVAMLVRNAKVGSKRSHRALADDAGVAASTITRIQANRIEPTVEVLERILDACGYELELRAVRKGAPAIAGLGSLTDAWTEGPDGRLLLDWTRWRAYLDSLARHPARVPETIYSAPPPSGHAVIDVLLAAIAEKLADDAGLPRPSWTSAVPGLVEPFAPPARRRGAIPEQLERRGLLIDGESLFRRSETVGL